MKRDFIIMCDRCVQPIRQDRRGWYVLSSNKRVRHCGWWLWLRRHVPTEGW